MKAHDVFPAVCVPDYFYQQLRVSLEGEWHLFDPHEVLEKKGWALEDSFGEEWTRKYMELISDESVSRRVLPLKDVIRMVIKSAVETGTPFVFNREPSTASTPTRTGGSSTAATCAPRSRRICPASARWKSGRRPSTGTPWWSS